MKKLGKSDVVIGTNSLNTVGIEQSLESHGDKVVYTLSAEHIQATDNLPFAYIG